MEQFFCIANVTLAWFGKNYWIIIIASSLTKKHETDINIFRSSWNSQYIEVEWCRFQLFVSTRGIRLIIYLLSHSFIVNQLWLIDYESKYIILVLYNIAYIRKILSDYDQCLLNCNGDDGCKASCVTNLKKEHKDCPRQVFNEKYYPSLR